MSFAITAVIKAVDQASRILEHVNESVNRMSRGFNHLGDVAKNAGGFIIAQIGMRAMDAVQNFVSGSIDAFAAQEFAIVSLKTQMEILGEDWSAVGADMIAKAQELQKTTVYSDDQIVAAMQRLATFGMSSRDIMASIGSVMDLAAAKGLDLSTAADLVGKAFAGHTETLGRYGVEVEKGADRSETFRNVMTLLNLQFGGVAQAQVDTFSGKMAQFNNRVNDIQENIGGRLVPALQSLLPVAETAVRAVGFAFEGMIAAAAGWSIMIQQAAQGWTWVFTSALPEALTNAVHMITGGFNYVKDQASAFAAWILEKISGAAGWIIDKVNWLRDRWNEVWRAIGGGLQWVYDNMIKPTVDLILALVERVRNVFAWLQQRLVGGSIWTNMWSDMAKVAEKGVADINRSISGLTGLGGFGGAGVGRGGYAAGSITVIINATTSASASDIGEAVVSALRRRRR